MLDSRYRIDHLLGVGGMGEVYAGCHVPLQKTVAIKVLRAELAETPDMVERFQREAVAASRIGHENIVQVTDIGQTPDGAPFLVMEYLEGQDLGKRIDSRGRLPVGRACYLCTEILAAIGAAHAAGIIHRDLKPENIFLARQSRCEQVKILDFGISRIAGTGEPVRRLTHTGVVLGTPMYMAPEQASGEVEVTPAADIYAIGAILYEMITGHEPFDGGTYNAVIVKVVMGELVPPRHHVPELDPAVDAIIRTAMALQPAERYPSAAAFAQALAPYVILPQSDQSFPGLSPASPTATTASLRSNPDAAATGRDHRPTALAQTQPSQELLAPPDTLPARAPGAAAAPSAPGPAATAAAGPTAAVPARPAGRSRLWWAAVPLLAAAGAGVAWWQISQAPAAADPAEPADRAPAAAVAAPPDPTSAPAAPTVPSNAAAPDAQSLVTITFHLSPDDATVVIDGAELAGRELVRPRSSGPVEVEVRRDGYEPKQRTVELGGDREIEFVLEPVPEPSSRTRRTRRGGTSRGGTRRGERIIKDSPYDD